MDLERHRTVAVTRTRGAVIVTMQPDLEPAMFDQLQESVLQQLHGHRHRAVVLDFSAVDMLSLCEFERCRKLLSAAGLLHAARIVVSLRPDIVMYLTEMQAQTQGIDFFFSLEEALQRYGGD